MTIKTLFHKVINSYLYRRQELQFAVHKTLRAISKINDPLFECKFQPGQDIEVDYVAEFNVILRSSGLGIKGYVEVNQQLEKVPDSIDLILDGRVIRNEPLKLQGNRASFAFPVKRSTVAHFPKYCELQVRTSQGQIIPWKGSDRLCLECPSGTGLIHQLIAQRGLLDKKGFLKLSAEEVRARQNAYLELYAKVREVFDKEVGKPLFLMYGTLLGLYRDGDFIPGDDDFDVGYASQVHDPVSAKKEVIEIINILIKAGFTIVFNQRGKPFRIKETPGEPEIHLDVRPIWYQDGHVWAHKQACLPLDMASFENVNTTTLRGTKVYIPSSTEGFLRAYYGEGWNIPDPGFSNSSVVVPKYVQENLEANCFTPHELLKLKKTINKQRARNPGYGELIALGLLDLYPLKDENIVKRELVQRIDSIDIIAHRGRLGNYPENCITSLVNLPINVTGVEVDVRVTKDMVPVLMHDHTVERTTNGFGTVSELNLKYVESLKIGFKSNVPTLENYLLVCDQYRIRQVLLDIKAVDKQAIEMIAKVVEKSSICEKIICLFQDEAAAQILRIALPNIRIGLLRTTSENVNHRIEIAQKCNAEFLFVRHGDEAYITNREVVTQVRTKGLSVGGSVINENRAYSKVIEDKCNLIITDRIDLFANIARQSYYTSCKLKK